MELFLSEPHLLSPEAATCARVSATLLKKETLEQTFSCEFCEISKNTFFTEDLWATASLNLPFSK